MWGGPVPDPTMALCKILARLLNDDGSINLPGIYDKVRPLTDAEEKKSLAALPSDDALFRKQAGMLPGVQLLGGAAAVGDELAPAFPRGQRHPGQLAPGRAQHHLRQRLGAGRASAPCPTWT